MKRIIPNKSTFKQLTANVDRSIDYLLAKTECWTSEINFIEVEQLFLKELLSEHIIGFCKTQNYQKAKFLLNGIEHEYKLGKELNNEIKKHAVNLVLLQENILVKREINFRNHHKYMETEVSNYIENFKYIKEQIFELVLVIMKKEKDIRRLTG